MRIWHGSLPFLEPRLHRSVRSATIRVLNRHVRTRIAPMITPLADECVRRISVRHPADVMREVANVVPQTLACRLLGISAADQEQLCRDATILGKNVEAFPVRASVRAAESSAERLMAYFVRTVESARRGGDGFVSDLLLVPGLASLGPERMAAHLAFLLIAAQITTASLIGSALDVVAATGPGMLEVVRDDHMRAQLVQEVLRLETPFRSAPRQALRPLSIGGVTLSEGAKVVLHLGSANRDPEVFDQPVTIDLNRTAPHLAFGGGERTCPGAMLANLEADAVLAAFGSRFRTMVRIARPQWEKHSTLRILESLKVWVD